MTRMLLIAALAAATCLWGQVSVGVTIGRPPMPRVLRAIPAAPAPEYLWIGGYWYPVGGRYKWHAGYWTRPPYIGAEWIGPRYEGGKFYAGYWGGPRGRVEHDHAWDRDRNRDYDRFRDRR